jgi:hypothetical protein
MIPIGPNVNAKRHPQPPELDIEQSKWTAEIRGLLSVQGGDSRCGAAKPWFL